ncbi:hypothetical protein MCUN1_000565 [Malassezia cuniculi]|uniref:Uncharacterized protein n=1 Tax=Malassezia cuniculi TaxID=948313 RepID=A0AAF0J566_9BASI|nr:hypothetical protein MCUN1_000565 [Malassezia cuniculi]
MSGNASYLSAQPGFLQGPQRKAAPPANWFQRFWSEQITHPAKIWGNVSVAWSISFFALGILFVRKAGHVLAPVF